MHISPSRGVYELLTMKPEQPLWKEVASSLWAVLKTIGRYYEFATGFKYLHTVPRPLFQGEYHSKQSCERQAAQPQGCFPPKESPAHQHKVVSAFISTQIGNNCVTIKTGGWDRRKAQWRHGAAPHQCLLLPDTSSFVWSRQGSSKAERKTWHRRHFERERRGKELWGQFKFSSKPGFYRNAVVNAADSWILSFKAHRASQACTVTYITHSHSLTRSC